MECVLQSIYNFVNCENIEDEDDIETLYWVLFLHFSESSTLKQIKVFNWSVTRSDDLLTLERGSRCLMKSRMMMVKMTMLMMELEMTTLDLRRTLDDCHPPWSHPALSQTSCIFPQVSPKIFLLKYFLPGATSNKIFANK